MTDPNTQPSQKPSEVQSLVDWLDNERHRIALQMQRFHIGYGTVIAVILVSVFFAGRELYQAHLRKIAKLEAQASVMQLQLAQERAAGDAWRTKYEAAKAVRITDTVHTLKVIAATQTFTAPVPVSHPDGSISEVPMQVVLKSDNDALAASCTRERHDCTAALAAADSQHVHDSLYAARLDSLNHNTTQRLAHTKSASKYEKIGYALAGLLTGRASCLK